MKINKPMAAITTLAASNGYIIANWYILSISEKAVFPPLNVIFGATAFVALDLAMVAVVFSEPEKDWLGWFLTVLTIATTCAFSGGIAWHLFGDLWHTAFAAAQFMIALHVTHDRKLAHRRQAEAQKRQAEAEAQKRQAEAEARRAEAEAQKRKAEAEAQKRQAEAEAQKRKAEAEAQKRQAEAQKRQAEAQKRQAEAEAQKRQAEAEAQKRQAEAEAQKRQAEAEARRAEAQKRQAEAQKSGIEIAFMLLDGGGSITNKELSEAAGVSESAARNYRSKWKRQRQLNGHHQ